MITGAPGAFMVMNMGGGKGPDSWWEIVVILLCALLFVWVSFILMLWIFPMGEPKTLVEILLNQWKYITSLRIW